MVGDFTVSNYVGTVTRNDFNVTTDSGTLQPYSAGYILRYDAGTGSSKNDWCDGGYAGTGFTKLFLAKEFGNAITPYLYEPWNDVTKDNLIGTWSDHLDKKQQITYGNMWINNNKTSTHDWTNDVNNWVMEGYDVGGEYYNFNGAPAPAVHARKRQALNTCAPEEAKARQLLHRFIGDRRFRRYMRDSFITHVGKSGLTYKIKPGHGITEVYDKGKHLYGLCLIFQDRKIPPTDAIVMRLLMIEHSEEDHKAQSVVHQRYQAPAAVNIAA